MKKNKKNKQQINYLDLIPVRPEKLGCAGKLSVAVDRRGADSDGTGRSSERTFWRSSRAAVSKNCEIFSDFRELSFYQL